MAVMLHLGACDNMLDVDLDKSKITTDRVFSDDLVATAAMNGIYAEMFKPENFASGSGTSVTVLSGLLSDELDTYATSSTVNEFSQNDLHPSNTDVLNLWISLYETIYRANAMIEGVNESTAITTATRIQLGAEARFVRAFCNFYLVNFFGAAPLNVATDYRVNAMAGRSPEERIYQQILADVDTAEANLSDNYVTFNRARPNRAAASSLKARVALFMRQWAEAEESASTVINDPQYVLVPLNEVFKTASQEAIWQIEPVEVYMTNEANAFILTMSPSESGSSYNALRENFINSFEAGDARKDSWVGLFSSEAGTWYYPAKYKVTALDEPTFLDESSVVFRLAEIYLIRAEARARQEKFGEAIADVDSVRKRAGLPLVSQSGVVISSDSLLSLIVHERRIELFTEWGHRWLDLKRTQTSSDLLGPIKPRWNAGDELLPIPQVERNRNTNLGGQNPGYF